MFGGGGFATTPLGGLIADDGSAIDPTSLRPILTQINNVDRREFVAVDSIRIQDTLGQPVTCSLTFVTPAFMPEEGAPIRIFYHSQVIFAGTIDHVNKTSPDLTTVLYQCDCRDLSHTLFRRSLRRNFTDAPIKNILASILNNELADEPLTIGTIDTRATLPLVDSRGGRVFDVCRDMAGATGQTFYVDFNGSIEMRSTTAPIAPLVLDEANVLVESTRVDSDRETYRNVQIVQVTGTPGEDDDARVVTIERTNADQIAARAALEGTGGRYEAIEEVTHPTSNDAGELALLGIGYANLRLATSGTPRYTLSCRARGYGFRAGQIATVDLPTFGVTGTFVIQRVSIREHAGLFLFHDLELTNSSLQQRAYESWLSIVRGNKVTVQVPTSITNNLQTFNVPGADTWTVPAGVTMVEFTCYGASGGGGDSDFVTFSNWAKGGKGGKGGKSISIVTLTEGTVIDITVGAGGIGAIYASDDDGTGGTVTTVTIGAVTLCQADGGGGGKDAVTNPTPPHFPTSPGANGAPGSGVGDAVSVGGGKIGGNGGIAVPITNAGNGQDGLVEVRW